MQKKQTQQEASQGHFGRKLFLHSKPWQVSYIEGIEAMNKFFLFLSYLAMCGVGIGIGSLVTHFDIEHLDNWNPTTTVILLLCNIIAFVAMLLLAVKG